MADLDADTRLVPDGPGCFTAELNPEWNVWGPMGGYLAAMALRAAATATALPVPASLSCHFLAVAYFEPVRLRVERLQRSRRAESVRVTLSQGDRVVLVALVWAHTGTGWGPAAQWREAPAIPPPAELPTLEDSVEAEGGLVMPSWLTCFEVRLGGVHGEGLERPARDPRVFGWTRMRTPLRPDADGWLDACRAVIAVDLVQFPAVTQGFAARELTFIAPSLDLYVAFHGEPGRGEWLLVSGDGLAAGGGLASARSDVWRADGTLVATATQQMLVRRA